VPVEEIWRTIWAEKANSHLAAQLGLPPLLYIQLPGGRMWSKRTAVRQWVATNPRRPVILADADPLIRRCRKWRHRLQPESLIVNPDKAVGLTPAHVDTIRLFVDRLS